MRPPPKVCHAPARLLWRRAGLAMPTLVGWALTFVFVVLTWVLFRAGTFDTAVAIFKALFGFAELGRGFKWRSIALAALVATIGPTAWAFVHRLPPWRSIAIAFAKASRVFSGASRASPRWANTRGRAGER